MSASGNELPSESQLVTKKVVQSNNGRRGHSDLCGMHVCMYVHVAEGDYKHMYTSLNYTWTHHGEGMSLILTVICRYQPSCA